MNKDFKQRLLDKFGKFKEIGDNWFTKKKDKLFHMHISEEPVKELRIEHNLNTCDLNVALEIKKPGNLYWCDKIANVKILNRNEILIVLETEAFLKVTLTKFTDKLPEF